MIPRRPPQGALDVFLKTLTGDPGPIIISNYQ